MRKITLFFFVLSGLLSTAQIAITGSNFTATGAQFNLVFTDDEVTGTLTSIDMDATLGASTSFTYANDLMVYITATSDINSAGILQAGGFSNFGAAERISWTSGGSEMVGTRVMESQALTTPLNFATNPTYNIWLGNGYVDANPPTTSGTWNNINIVLNGVSEVALSTDDQIKNAFSVHPNPVKDFAFISNTDKSLEITKVGIMDVSGKAIKTIILGRASTDTRINVSDLSAGVYLFVIDSNKGKSVQKFVKQ